MIKDFGIEIKLACVSKGIPNDIFEFGWFDKLVFNKKNNILKIGVSAAVYFAEGNAIWICNMDFEISILPNTNFSLCISIGLGHKSIQGNRFYMNLH